MAGDLPAGVAESLRHLRGLVQHPLLGLLVKEMQVGDTVAEGAGIAGEGHDALGALPGELGMLLDVGIQNGHHVAVIGGLAALHRQHLFAVVDDGAAHDGDHVALVVHVQTAGEAVIQHIVVIIHVVDGQHQGLFAGGQVDVLEDGLAVHLLHHVGDIVENEAGLLQQGQHGLELGHGGHEVVVAGLFPVTVKGEGGVGSQTVEEDVVILSALVLYKAFLGLFHILQQGGGVGVHQFTAVFQQGDGIVIVIATEQQLGLLQQHLPLCLQGGLVHRGLGVVLRRSLLFLLLTGEYIFHRIGQGIFVVQRPHQCRDGKNHRDDGDDQKNQNHRQLDAAAAVGIFPSCHGKTSSICKAYDFLTIAYHNSIRFGSDFSKISEFFQKWVDG